MAITIKTKEQIAALRECGALHAQVLEQLIALIKPGISTKELDEHAFRMIQQRGAQPSFLGYRPDAHHNPFPASICVSINEEVVHGIPQEDRIIQEGDLVSLDVGIHYKGVFTDAARTIAVGQVSAEKRELIYATEAALMAGIMAAQPGARVGDIGYAIQSSNGGKYGNVRELAGHGVGLAVHEDPFVPNYGKAGQGALLKEAMVLAIEPMFNLGSSHIIFHDDGYTVTTADKQCSAHIEDTILITTEGPEILTRN